ncbi:MAG: hypothetical protein H7Y31_17150 [Chitinophagaceae bacterium]|nr:hypothetical protein [Chitinophagaceae bacterium]
MIYQFIHYSLHFLLPATIAFAFYRKTWQLTYLIFLATMLVDLDHLFAAPVYAPCRCSIGYHFLHSYVAILIYVVLLFPKQTRVVGIGLLLHMATDYIDCLMQKIYC